MFDLVNAPTVSYCSFGFFRGIIIICLSCTKGSLCSFVFYSVYLLGETVNCLFTDLFEFFDLPCDYKVKCTKVERHVRVLGNAVMPSR